MRRQTPVRRPRRRTSQSAVRSARRRRPLTWRAKLILASAVALVALVLLAVIARSFAPGGNTGASTFDAIIVLGARLDARGDPGPTLVDRITEAVHEYDRGKAPRLIVTGGPNREGFTESAAMARMAQAQGVPGSAIVEEVQAEDTIENACYSARIMKQHGWHSAEVVTSPSHLPRAGIIFSKVPILWRAHAAPPLTQPSTVSDWGSTLYEVVHTDYYLLYSQWAHRCSP